MQTSGNLVSTLIELTAGVQDGQNHLQCRFSLFLMNINGNTAAIICNFYGIIFIDYDIDMRAETRQSLID